MKYPEMAYIALGAGNEKLYGPIPVDCKEKHFKLKLCNFQLKDTCEKQQEHFDHCLHLYQTKKDNLLAHKAYVLNQEKAREENFAPSLPELFKLAKF